MKNYGISRKLIKEKILYKVAQLQYFFLKHFARSDKMRDFYTYTYSRHFTPQSPNPRHDYSVPAGKHCRPVALVTSDLILRENLPQLKRGLVKLLKNHHSHKFLGGFKSIEDILDSVENMDDTLTWSYSSIDAGRFDFDSLQDIAPYISYFDLHIRKINDSYLCVETHIYFNEDYANNLQTIIDSDITEQKTYIKYAFRRNNKKSGGKRTFSLCQYNEANQKSDEIFESITSVKWLFYNRLQKFFTTELHNLNIVPPGILFYETNIDYTDQSADYFWQSLGISDYKGQFIDPARKLFFEMDLSGRYPKHFSPDFIYIYHDGKIPLEAGIYSLDFQIIHFFCWDYSRDIFRFFFLEVFNSYFSKKLVQYKHRLNKIKLKKNQFHSLLKLRYRFERDMDMYVRLTSDAIWENAKKTITELFNEKIIIRGYDYRYITDFPIASMNRIRDQLSVLTKDFEDKANVLQHLTEYKHESRTRVVNYIMLFMAALTLILLIFPDWSKFIASFLSNAWIWIKSLLG